MRYAFERIVDPDIEPLTLAEMKVHLRTYSDVSDEDAYITDLMIGAREWCEEHTGRALIDQAWRLTLAGNLTRFVGGDVVGGHTPGYIPIGRHEWLHWLRRGEIMLRKSPVLEVVSIASVDIAGIETVVDSATYELREKDSKWPRIVPLNGMTWPSGYDLRIVFRAGFANRDLSPQEDASVVPSKYKQAIRLHTEANYDRDKDLMKIYMDAAERLVKADRSEMNMA